MLAPHHGRKSGYYSELFNHFSPILTVVSDGPVCDTTAVNRYTQASTGVNVLKSNGQRDIRKCLTTRNDGTVIVEVSAGMNNLPNIDVKIK